MIISLDAKKAYEKIHHPFMTKIMERAGMQGSYLNTIKAIYSKPTDNSQHQTKWRESPSDSTEIRIKTRLSTLSICIQYSSCEPSYSNKTPKGNQVNTNQKNRSHTLTIC